jgi:PAS domain S-box-containing protein
MSLRNAARRVALAIDRARRARASHDAQPRFHDLVQGLPGVVWEMDPRTLRFTFVSRHAEEMLGYPAERWGGPDFLRTLVHPDDRARVLAQREQAGRDGLGHDIEYRALAADGRVVWVRDIGRVVRDSAGTVRWLRGVMADATTRRRGEEALAQLAALVESSGDAIFGTTLDGTILSWNAGAERLYGYAAGEMVGRSVERLLPAERAGEIARLGERLQRGETVAGYETVRMAKDGRSLDVSLTLSPVRAADGALVAVSAVARDVSGRKRAERRLAAQYAVGRALGEAARLAEATPRVLQAVGEGLGRTLGALWIVDADAGLLRCADVWDAGQPVAPTSHAIVREATFAQGAGVAGRAWLAGAPVWVADLLEEPEAKRGLAGCRDGLRGAFAFPVRGKAGVLGVVEFVSGRIRPPDPDLILMVGALGHQIGQFIERRQAELAVRESEALKGAVLDTAIDGIITIDHEGRVIEFNPAAERIFGYTRREAIGRELASLIVPPALRARYREDFARSVGRGDARVIEPQTEMLAMRADASEFAVEMAILRIPMPFPRPPVFTGYVRDISERKRAEASERNAEALRSVARLANAAGHEINNPLTVIITSLEMLGKDLESGPVSPAKVKPILAAAERIRDVIAHMRRLTRLELVSREPHLPEMLDLRESSPGGQRTEPDEP